MVSPIQPSSCIFLPETVQRAPRTPTSARNFPQIAEHLEPVASPTTPTLNSDRSVNAGISPLLNSDATLRQAPQPRGILRNKRPSPINVVENQWSPTPVRRLLPQNNDDDQGKSVSPGPSGWSPTPKGKHGGKPFSSELMLPPPLTQLQNKVHYQVRNWIATTHTIKLLFLQL